MRGFLARYRTLRKRGVLGMNERNSTYVLPLNPRRHYPRVDDKLLTKRLAEAAGIPIPKTLGVIAYHHELRRLPEVLAGFQQFVLKPTRGAQGNGIVVIVGVENGCFRKSSGVSLDLPHVQQHISSMLSGVFSLGGDADRCLIEARVILHPAFEPIARFGIPDIRVVVYRGVPVMAMCRLPTTASDGRANLHQGAIGAGIDLASGRIVHAAYHNHSVVDHIDTGARVVGFEIPCWDAVLDLSARAAEISGLGYIGVDLVVDVEHGPLLLELNARPGLAIQVANRQGLIPRIRIADAAPAQLLESPERRCQFAREAFASAAL